MKTKLGPACWFCLISVCVVTAFAPVVTHNVRTHTLTTSVLFGKRGKRNNDMDRASPPQKYLDLETIDWFDRSTNLNEVKNSMNDFAKEYYKTGGDVTFNGGGDKQAFSPNSSKKGAAGNGRQSKAGGNAGSKPPPPSPEGALNNFEYGMVRKTEARANSKMSKNR